MTRQPEQRLASRCLREASGRAGRPPWSRPVRYPYFEPFRAEAKVVPGKSGDVAARSGGTLDEAAADRVEDSHKHDRNRLGLLLQRGEDSGGIRQDRVRRKGNQLRGIGSRALGGTSGEANVEPSIACFDPAQILHAFAKYREASLLLRITGDTDQHADPPYPIRLLRPRLARPRRRAAEQGDELAPFHSITSSARSRIDVGSVTPIALAVFRLSANSKFAACSTGRSAGCAPRRILAT